MSINLYLCLHNYITSKNDKLSCYIGKPLYSKTQPSLLLKFNIKFDSILPKKHSPGVLG
uniref:Uncharacterized protein n=1 Tax=Manihot esculenta TaxID=3983 RepID=A0A2C9VXY2_MANES